MKETGTGTGFWRTAPGILTGIAGAIAAVASLIAALSQAGLIGSLEPTAAAGSFVESSPDDATANAAAVDVTGRWSATVEYPWGVTVEETLDVQVEDGRVSGSASYLGVPRAMASARISGNRITFFTRAEEILGDESRRYENHYDGLIAADRIDFSLTDTRGEGPVRFTMRRR